VALVFAVFGLEKLAGTQWNALFDALGFGRGFQYLTGVFQLGGAALLLIPRAARLGGALIASTMVGAMVANLFLLNTGIAGAVVPAMLLALVIGAAYKGRGEAPEATLSVR